MKQGWRRNLGANTTKKGTHFCVWAPYAEKVDVKVTSDKSRMIPMKKDRHGYYEAVDDSIVEGDEYFYLLDDFKERPDPASRSQPYGVHGPSKVTDSSSFRWSDEQWSNPPLKNYIIYEMHIGTFTEQGTFDSAIDKLDHLIELGITAIEIMPVAAFPGNRNWGYDGVLPYAAQICYGGVKGLKAFVNACHLKGIAVILDVVYNHIGPEGNYLEDFGPYYTDRYHTPWGKAINFDGQGSEGVRNYILGNALYWIEECHIDALRLDAVHAIFDKSETHILKEMHDDIKGLKKRAYLIAESDLNEPTLIKSECDGGYGLDGQWNDDFHHAMTAYLLKKQTGYFQDFGSIGDIAKAVTEGYVYDGRWSTFRGKKHGSSSKGIPADKFVNFLQNHDQIANASQGMPIGKVMGDDRHRLAALILFFSPEIPMLFMGQEWASTTPFNYFTDFGDPALQEAVSEGRKKEYASLGISKGFSDPSALQTFQDSKLDWGWNRDPRALDFFEYYRRLIQLRKEHTCLTSGNVDFTNIEFNEKKRWLKIERSEGAGKGRRLLLICNLSDTPQKIPIPEAYCEAQISFNSCQGVTKEINSEFSAWEGRIYRSASS